MNKEKKVFLGVIIILVIISIVTVAMALKDKKTEVNIITNSDAENFKNEYESLNNLVNNNVIMPEVSIDSDNPVTILNEDKTLDLLKTSTGILYLGYPDSTGCRLFLPILLKTINNAGIDKLFYLNIKNIRDEISIDSKGNPETTIEGSRVYLEMLNILDDYLKPYYLKDKDGNEISPSEKRIYAPMLIGIKDGEIVGTFNELDENFNEELSKEKTEEIVNKIMEIINKVYNINCDEAC